MEKITTRTATLNDLPTLLRFEQGVISAERPFDETLKPDPIQYYDLPYMIQAEHIHLIVAEAEGNIVGSGYARIDNSRHFQRFEQHAYLGFMYVDPAFRGRGINNMIIDSLKQWALSRNLTEMRLEVYEKNLPAIKAYEKAGFSPILIEMRLGID